MRRLSILFGSFLMSLSGLANAGVWYQWHATNHVAPFGITLMLEFDPAAVKAGSFSMQFNEISNEHNPNHIYPTSGLLTLSYTTGTGGGITWKPREGITSPGPAILDMHIVFSPGFHLSGHLYAHNFDSQFGIATGNGSDPNFTLYQASSDAGMNGCGWPSSEAPCFGATGQLRQIPEPGTIAMLGLGLGAVGLLGARRRPAAR